MDLDDQLAALAAGELDDATARALRARAAADPALARRLARHEHLQELLTTWDGPALSDEAAARLDARVDAALAALDDGPLAEADTPSVAPVPLAATSESAAASPPVTDLGAARQRRSDRGAEAATGAGFAWPSWAPAAAVAAALVAVVGTGVVVGGLPGGMDLDTMAQDDSAEESAEDSAAEAELFEDTPADDSAAGADGTAEFGTARGTGIEVEEGELLALVDGRTTEDTAVTEEDGGDDTDADTTSAQDADEPGTEAGPDPSCLVEALERDTVPSDGRELHLLASGTYDGQEASFVVLRSGDQFEVLAYDPATCDLLARDATTR